MLRRGVAQGTKRSGAFELGKLMAVFNTVLMVGYPLAVYVGLTRLSARWVGLLLLCLLLPGVVSRVRKASRDDLLTVLAVPATIALLVGGAALFDDQRLILALPVAINLALLSHFGASLRTIPMIERFARMQDPDLGPEQVRYCRTLTKVWCGFFVLNASVSAVLAVAAPLTWWATYTGLLSYIAIGTLGGTEYVFRKYRFREYGDSWIDRAISRVFPPPETNGGVP